MEAIKNKDSITKYKNSTEFLDYLKLEQQTRQLSVLT